MGVYLGISLSLGLSLGIQLYIRYVDARLLRVGVWVVDTDFKD